MYFYKPSLITIFQIILEHNPSFQHLVVLLIIFSLPMINEVILQMCYCDVYFTSYGPKTEVGNYRPISLLTAFSKIYEKLMYCRILKFLESNNSLFEMQYGFRPGRTCEHALLNAQNSFLKSLSKHQISLLLLIDFSKAFDMVEHSILIKKLEHYGIRGVETK